ncbi:hypothetical protein EI42_04557 [Thermosporothrix hazakensis]|jgi:hypothetical protein|uniref:DUF8166 domain-containing protein n=1 Tax=Thermosporothrix hazakensis TaxID=644383 RepID=A0A326UAD1_THEHA|nr:hypothetical protein [Thermosporothrix hazakensis]PZW24675.1 hypothetical protein EI42_04557 [Thermosporothrix hazakensis]GCE48378.1 hypothetical protein KTH_32470 [Thermosporothrix hazakensis]
MVIGKIVKSDSHINYVCQIFGPREVDIVPRPADYAFGRFVRVAIRAGEYDESMPFKQLLGSSSEPVTYAVGVIYDTILQNPAYGTLGPRLSNEAQLELFSPDYISEKAVLIYVIILGTMEEQQNADGSVTVLSASHGIPPLSLELDSEIETMNNEEVRAFHFFRDPDRPDQPEPYLQMGYLPHIIAQRSNLLPMVVLRIIDQLERLFPHNLALLSIVKRNFAWRLKVETTG